MKWISLLIGLGMGQQSLGMIQSAELIEPTVHFYRSPASQFPSGEAAINLLKEKQINSRSDVGYWVDTGNGKQWIPSQNLYYLRDFYNQTPGLQSGIVKINTPSLRYKNGWRPAGTIKTGSSIQITGIRSDWSCGKDELGPVCVPTKSLLLAIDTALRIQLSTGTWMPMKHRLINKILTTTNHLIPIDKIKGWESDPNVAFVRPEPANGSESQSAGITMGGQPPPFKKVALLQKEIRGWNQSILSDHGNVWWKRINQSELVDAPIMLNRDELIGRGVYDQARRLKTSLIAANGIFISNDGDTWTFLKQFGEANHPVTIGPRDSLVVGDQISLDKGKSFQGYLRWDQIASDVQESLGHSPTHLRLQKVKSAGVNSIAVEIDTGYKIFVFEFNIVNTQLTLTGSFLRR